MRVPLAHAMEKKNSTDLPHDCAFEHNQHEQREQAIVPILVETP